MPPRPRLKKMDTIAQAQEVGPETHVPLIFVSHDSKDSDLAEAFGKLDGSVSAGVLKIFRSSDKKGSQGIEYGVEWYPRLMEKLKQASDVVCLLTRNSVNRPWILYETGVAKGKLDTPVYGIALGIPLSKANSGPFAQFQNCDDNEESITKLVMQLLERIPGSEPDRDAILMQVKIFKQSVKKSITLEKKEGREAGESITEESMPKLFEEIKVMFKDLSNRIGQVPMRRPSKSRISYRLWLDFGEYLVRGRQDPNGILVMFTIFRDDLPWFYEIGVDFWRAVKSGNRKKIVAAFREYESMHELIKRGPFLEQLDSPPEILDYLHRMLELFLREPARTSRFDTQKRAEEKGSD